MKNLLRFALSGLAAVWIGCSSDSSAFSPSNKAVTDDGTATSTGTFTVSRDVDFGDTKLRDAVMLKLGIHAPLVPTEADMDSLRVLDASNKGITSLRGLQHATNLDTLILRVNSITSVAPLAGLTGLEYLSLSGNSIEDVTPLAGLENLETLLLYQSGLTDVSSLKTLTKLKVLSVGSNRQLGDAQISGLVADMTDLTRLKVNGTSLTDISFLEKLTKLENLNISANRGITNFKPLACLDALRILHLRNLNIAWSTGLDGELISSDDHIQYLINIGVTIHRSQ